MRFMLGWGSKPKLNDGGLKHGPKAISDAFEEFALFLYLGPRMGLIKVMRWPKNTSYNRHVSIIKSIL